MPAHPSPAIALPTINAEEFGAVPQTKDPTSKMIIANKKVHFTEAWPYNLPNKSWKEQVVRR